MKTEARDNTKLAEHMAFVERYVLSMVYLYFAARIFWVDYHGEIGYISSGSWPPTFPQAAADVFLFFMQFFIALMLFFSKRPAPQSPTLQEIFVPLAAAFFFLAYYTIAWFPYSMQRNLYLTVWPDRLTDLHPLDAFGLFVGMLGPAISLWGVIALRRSFGIFVSVREIVLRGPYRYVRHPIYLGYVLSYGGLILLNRSVAIAIIGYVHLMIFIWRAKLEERKLAAHSEAYRENMKNTGFLFPKIFGRK